MSFFSIQGRSLIRILSLTSTASVGVMVLFVLGCGGAKAPVAGPVPIPEPLPTPIPLPTPLLPTPFDTYKLTGDVTLVHDPSIIRQGSTYYSLSTDPGDPPGKPQVGFLPIRCSQDKLAWTRCGQVFNAVPQTVLNVFPTLTVLWAADVSYFDGLYHVYYAASIFGTNYSLIALATNTTMDANDPAYKWVDRGLVLASQGTDNFNAIDPTVLVDADATGITTHVWMAYGSYWGGIFERELNPATGMLSTSNLAVTNLATRPAVLNNPIEGSSLVKRNGLYYLFVSWDYCCQPTLAQDNYKIAVGRSTSPNGPFVDQTGTPMLQGGGTLLLTGNGTTWAAPGGETVYIDPSGGDLITFHALNLAQNGLDYLFVNSLTWPNDWPQIQP